ncbi:response regulator [Polyangium aurulentum]|uniref:response regulator n=1 Tax=Polyangium aurulentum TaxID=2567896 RepID=UPI0010AE7872|nr:response regulator [Polyangium aurulentum]UQA57975.1 response regulator [Polyangium aurulentum]
MALHREPVVLIADDDPHSIELIHSALGGEPIELTVANDGKGTLKAALSGQPDIILLDVLMEGIDGFEICRMLKDEEATREIPIVFMTSITDVSARVKAFRLGGVDYIVKPFEPEELVARVRTQLSLRSMTKFLKEHNSRLERQIAERVAAEAARDELTRELVARTEELRQANEMLSRELRERELSEVARAALQDQLLLAHQQRLRELSTPLMPISDKVMVMPLIGSMDIQRAQQVMESALEGAAQRRAECVILDVTGMKEIDAGVADLLVRAGQGLRLLGARVIITGIRPEVARALVELGASLDTIVTRATLQDGVAHAMQVSGGKFVAPFRTRTS